MKKLIKSKKTIGIIKFILPIILGFGVFIILGFLMDESLRIKYWPLISGYFFPPLGKESIIPTGIYFGIHPIVMALSIAFVDIVVALFLVWNYDLAKKIPMVGRFMKKVEDKGISAEEKYGWIKPLRFIGIILFVIVPFQGSGGMMGSIIGRLLGMNPWNTFLAISIGAIVGTLLVAMFSEIFIIFVQINTTLTLILVGVIATIIISYIIIKKYLVNKKSKLKNLEK